MSGKPMENYGKWWFIVSFPIRNGDLWGLINGNNISLVGGWSMVNLWKIYGYSMVNRDLYGESMANIWLYMDNPW